LTHEKCPRKVFDASSKDLLEGSTLLAGVGGRGAVGLSMAEKER